MDAGHQSLKVSVGYNKKGQESQKKKKREHSKGFLPLIFPILEQLENATPSAPLLSNMCFWRF